MLKATQCGSSRYFMHVLGQLQSPAGCKVNQKKQIPIGRALPMFYAQYLHLRGHCLLYSVPQANVEMSYFHYYFSFAQVRPTLEDKCMKRFCWAIALALASLGYLLILVISIFPFWVRLVDEESHEVFFSGLFENCFHIRCLKPRPLTSKE